MVARLWSELSIFKRAMLGSVIFILLTSQLAKADAVRTPEGEAVVSEFLESLKSEVLTDLQAKVQTYVDLIDCFESASCQEADEILTKYREYRIYVGLVQYADLEMRMRQMSHGYVVHSGIRLYFTTRNEEGREEWALIQQIYRDDQGASTRTLANLQLNEQSREYYEMLQNIRRGSYSHYSAAVTEYLGAYPFFGLARSQSLTRQTAIEKIEDSGREFENVMNSVEGLQGHERFELLGFTAALEQAVNHLSDEQSTIIANYIQAMNNETRLWGKIKKIFTSWKTLALGTCHITTFALAAVPHPLVQIGRLGAGFLCASLGLTLTVKHLGETTADLIRQMQYGATQSFSREILNQYVRSYFTTLVMAMLYIIPAVPGLKSRAYGIQQNSAIIRRAYRMNKLNLRLRGRDLRFNRNSFSTDVRNLGRSYAQYYGEELAVNALLTAGGHYASAVSSLSRALSTYRFQVNPTQVIILPFSAALADV